MGHLDIRKKLQARRRRGAEINKSMVSHIQYMGDMRRQIDRDLNKAEHSRMKGQLSNPSAWHPQLMRDRYDELTKVLGK